MINNDQKSQKSYIEALFMEQMMALTKGKNAQKVRVRDMFGVRHQLIAPF